MMSSRCLSTDTRAHSDLRVVALGVYIIILTLLYSKGYTDTVAVLVIITIAALIISPVKRVETEATDSE